jgi:ribosome-associated protein
MGQSSHGFFIRACATVAWSCKKPWRSSVEEPLPIKDGIILPGHELWFVASRSGGPGGQHVNKTSSRVSLHWNLAASTVLDQAQKARVAQRLKNRISADGVLQIHESGHRSQHRNREEARKRLAELLIMALVIARKRWPTRAGKGAHLRRMESKRRRSLIKSWRRRPSEE